MARIGRVSSKGGATDPKLLTVPRQNLLHVGLVDERYGDVGHADSNWAQLVAGGFDFSDMVQHPILTGKSLEENGQ